MPLSQLCCSQGLARVNKLQSSCPSSSLHLLVPFPFVHQEPSDIKILQCWRCAGKCRVHGMEDKSDLKRAAVAVTLPWAAKAGDELAVAGSSNSHSLVDLDTFFFCYF